MSSWPAKDPDEILDYQVKWTDRLETGETITSSSWELDDGDVVLGATDVVTVDGDTFTTVWISGGTLGTMSEITNHIVTSAGRHYDKTARLRIRSR